MRYGIIADIHANLAAFTAVLEDIEHGGGVDELWCLGDTVGYGPDPHECIELLRRQKHIGVAGNHDWGAIDKTDTAYFNPDAAAACRWTARKLSAEDIEYLASLPPTIEKDDFTLAHGSPRDPVWEYVISTGIAGENFSFFTSPYCLVGHTHMPMVFSKENGACTFSRFSPNVKLFLGRTRLIINPGGVGQPRDGDPRASYAVYDRTASTVRLYRVEYDVKATQDKMMQCEMPIPLVVRLGDGR